MRTSASVRWSGVVTVALIFALLAWEVVKWIVG